MRVWLLSNGRGEDRAAALVAAELSRRQPALAVVGAPLVTCGDEFAARGVPTPITGVLPPSGGFPHGSLRALLGDLPAVPDYFRYVRRLRRLAGHSDEVVAVGDVFLAGLARLAFRRAVFHVALAKSVHGRRHSRLERHFLRRWTSLVFTRDQATAEDLESHGVRAAFVGNPLIDGIAPARGVPGVEGGRSDVPVVLLLPGSRSEAAANLVKLLDVALRVSDPATWTCAWPRAIPIEAGRRAALAAGWRAEVQAPAHLGAPVSSGLRRDTRCVMLVAGQFESLLAACDLVVGLAGSANEQAAAIGKPLVTLVGCGPQTTAARMAEQERLLGGAAQFVPGSITDIAAIVSGLLRSPAERDRRGQLGMARLGPAGGAARVAERLIREMAS